MWLGCRIRIASGADAQVIAGQLEEHRYHEGTCLIRVRVNAQRGSVRHVQRNHKMVLVGRMSGRLTRAFASCLILYATFPLDALAQTTPAAVAQPAAAQPFSAEQLDALLASIALYPDELLTQVLMASTFPLEVVAASRWLEDPAHKSLSGDALAKALEAEPWDPSVKSLVPIPAVLATLNTNLTWLQQL